MSQHRRHTKYHGIIHRVTACPPTTKCNTKEMAELYWSSAQTLPTTKSVWTHVKTARSGFDWMVAGCDDRIREMRYTTHQWNVSGRKTDIKSQTPGMVPEIWSRNLKESILENSTLLKDDLYQTIWRVYHMGQSNRDRGFQINRHNHNQKQATRSSTGTAHHWETNQWIFAMNTCENW